MPYIWPIDDSLILLCHFWINWSLRSCSTIDFNQLIFTKACWFYTLEYLITQSKNIFNTRAAKNSHKVLLQNLSFINAYKTLLFGLKSDFAQWDIIIIIVTYKSETTCFSIDHITWSTTFKLKMYLNIFTVVDIFFYLSYIHHVEQLLSK